MEKSDNKILMIIVIIIVLIAGVGGFFYLKNKDNGEKPGENINPTPTPTVTVSPTPTPEKPKVLETRDALESCADYSKTFNNIKVDAKVSSSEDTCKYEIMINNNKVSNVEISDIKTIEVYNNYVNILVSNNNDSAIYLIDTADSNKTTVVNECDLGYHIDSYSAGDNGLLITGTEISDKCGTSKPNEKYAKFTIKYENNKFGKPYFEYGYDYRLDY